MTQRDHGTLYVVELHERDVQTSLGRLHLRVGGVPGNPAVLFWPSLLMDGRMWIEQAQFVADKHLVVLVDPPGHGLSEKLNAPFDFDACADAAAQVLDGLGIDRAHFVGCSWGAMTGITFAARYGERIGAAVLMNGTASPATRKARYEFGTVLTAARLTGRRRRLTDLSIDAFVGPTARRVHPHAARAVRDSVASLDLRSVVHAMRSVVIQRPDQRALLGDIAAPVMVVAGGEDPTFTVAETKAVADGISDAKLVVLPDSGHLAALESPRQVGELIEDFLASHA